jgi:hypothetical protein
MINMRKLDLNDNNKITDEGSKRMIYMQKKMILVIITI